MASVACAVTTWELRAKGGSSAHHGAQTREQWFRLLVYPHGRGGGSSHRIWRSVTQFWRLHEDLARLFPGYQPETIKRVTDPDVRYKLAQVFLDCVCGHKLLAHSPPVRHFFLPTNADTNLFRVVHKCTIRSGSDLSSQETGVLRSGSVVTALEQRREGGTLRLRIDRGWVSQTTGHAAEPLLFAESDRCTSSTLPGHYRVLRRTAIYTGSRKKPSKFGILDPGETLEVVSSEYTHGDTVGFRYMTSHCWAFIRNSRGALRLIKERDPDSVDAAKPECAHQGWLSKKGAKRHSPFIKRWFSLTDDQLSYACTPGGKTKGGIDLSKCTQVRLSETRGASSLEIEVVCEHETFRLQAEGQDDLNTWMEVLKPFGQVVTALEGQPTSLGDSEPEPEVEHPGKLKECSGGSIPEGEAQARGENAAEKARTVEAAKQEHEQQQQQEEEEEEEEVVDDDDDDDDDERNEAVEEEEDVTYWSWNRAEIADTDSTTTATSAGATRHRNETLMLSIKSVTGMTLDSGTTLVVDEVIENARNTNHVYNGEGPRDAGDHYSTDSLLPQERDEWSDVHGLPLSPPENDADAPANWIWLTSWTIDKTANNSDDDGWQYCHEWSLWPSLWHAHGHDGADHVRRRRWYRLRQNTLWRPDLAPQDLQCDALDLHRRRSRRMERGTCMLERMEHEMRDVAQAAVREKMEETVDLSVIEGHEDDAEFVLAVLETAPEEFRMRDPDAADDSCFVEPDDNEMLVRIYEKCIACLVGGRLQNPDEGVPAVLTENGCLILKGALINEDLHDVLHDADLVDMAVARSLVQEAELQHQLQQLDNHPFYTVDAFLREGAGAGKPFTAWKLAEQMRLEKLLTDYQSRDMFKGQMIFRCHAATGLKKGQHVACRIRIGPQWEYQTQVVTVDQQGVATWDTDLVFNLDADPALMGTVQHMKKDGREKAFPDCVVFEIVRTGGLDKNPKIVAGSARHKNTRQLWCPAPHFRAVGVEIACGWTTEHGHTKHRKSQDSHASLCILVQYSFRAKDVSPAAKEHSEDAHKEFRMLSRRLGECLEDNSISMRANSAFSWLLDNYAEYYGVGKVYSILYRLRVHLAHFDLNATNCVRVNIDLQRLQSETAEISEQHWTQAEREMFDDCVIHVESILYDSFTTINASFDNDVDLECAVSLYRTLVSARDDPFEEELYKVLIAGFDRVVDGVLGYKHVTVHTLHTLLQVVDHNMKEFDTTFRDGLPDGMPERVMRHMLEQCCSALLDTQASVGHDWMDALGAYDSLLLLIDTAQDLLQQPWLGDIDLQDFFAPTFEAFVDNNEDHLCKWASEAVVQDTWTALDDTNLHSSSVNDLVQFLVKCSGEFDGLASFQRESEVLTKVMIHYCKEVAKRCGQVLGSPSDFSLPARSGSLSHLMQTTAKAKHKVAAHPPTRTYHGKEEIDGAESHELDLGTLCVGINNIFVLGESHAHDFGNDPTRIMPSLDAIDEDFNTLDKISDVFLKTQLEIRKIWRPILDCLVDTHVVHMEQILVEISEETKTNVWDAVAVHLENFLEIVSAGLYDKAFNHVLKHLCCASFDMLERALCGNLKMVHAPPSGDGLSSLFKGLVETLSNMFSGSEDVGISSDQLARVALNVNKFLHYHTLPTEMLIQVYEANAEHDSMHADSSGEDISATRRLVSDQQHMLVTVLQIRADAAAKSSSKSRSSSIDEQVDAQLASKFVSELGTVAFGSPPPSLNLPADERLIAIARCRSGGAFGTLYVCTSYVCFEPLEHTQGDGEHVWRVRLADLTMARKDGNAPTRRHTPRSQHRGVELYLSTGSEDGAACFGNFDHVGARDATLAKIRELATSLGAHFDGHATSYELSIVTSEGENDGLSPSSAVISIQLAGDAASEEILFHSPNRESVSPGATLMLYHERRSAEEPFGKLVKIRVRLVSPSKKSVTAVWNHHLSWKVSEIRVVNTTDGSMSRFCGTSGWTELSAEPINMWSSSADQPDSQPVVTTVVEEIWENQRRRWAGYSAAARFPTDPPAFSDNAGMARYKESVTLPTAEEASILWTWLSEWEVEATRETDESGWGYATHWNKSWQDHSSKTTLVRRRKWFRVRKASLSPTVALNEDKATPEEGVPLNVGPPS